MKTKSVAMFLVLAATLRAGGPGAEMREGFVDAVEQTPAGWVATVTGVVDVITLDPKDRTGPAIVHLYADKAKIRVPIGNQLYALSGSGSLRYAKRMKEAVGQKMLIQMWGPIVVLDAGRVVEITAGDISLLRPKRDEAAFDIDRLSEITTSDARAQR